MKEICKSVKSFTFVHLTLLFTASGRYTECNFLFWISHYITKSLLVSFNTIVYEICSKMILLFQQLPSRQCVHIRMAEFHYRRRWRSPVVSMQSSDKQLYKHLKSSLGIFITTFHTINRLFHAENGLLCTE